MRRRDFLGAAVAAGLSGALPEHGEPDRRAVAEQVVAPGIGSPENGLADPHQRPWRRLFLDAKVVEESRGVARVFHAATKLRGNPVMRIGQSWEAGSAVAGPYVYGTIMQDGGRYRLWYQFINEGQHIGYAESPDGVEWTRPELGIIAIRGDRRNNLVVSDWDREATAGSCHNPSVIHQPWVADPLKRYALYGFDYAVGPRLAYSADGLHWRFSDAKETTPLFRSSDVVNFCWDPMEQRYLCTWKAASRRGRSVGVAWSDDGVQWTKPYDGPIFVADDLDPDACQVYGMPVFPYQGLYIGLPWMYHARYIKLGPYTPKAMLDAQQTSPRTVDVQLAWSWDLINWTRTPDRAPFIPRGREREFDAAMIYTARAPLRVGDELWFYYGGCVKPHDEPHDEAAIGLAKLRLDGFCSFRADADEGFVTSRAEALTVPEVTVNAAVETDGYIVAELLDERSRVVPGFGREDCVPITGDSVRHRLRWKSARFADEAKRPIVRIRFHMRRADLFAYVPQQVWQDDYVVDRKATGP